MKRYSVVRCNIGGCIFTRGNFCLLKLVYSTSRLDFLLTNMFIFLICLIRKLGSLKRTVRNKARVEGSIVESYLVKELATYCSLYFDPQIQTRHNQEPRNYAPDIPSSSGSDTRLNIFKHPCRRLFEKGGKPRALTDEELHKVHTYILFNCEEIHPFVWMFDAEIRQTQPFITDGDLDRARDAFFPKWFERYVSI